MTTGFLELDKAGKIFFNKFSFSAKTFISPRKPYKVDKFSKR